MTASFSCGAGFFLLGANSSTCRHAEAGGAEWSAAAHPGCKPCSSACLECTDQAQTCLRCARPARLQTDGSCREPPEWQLAMKILGSQGNPECVGTKADITSCEFFNFDHTAWTDTEVYGNQVRTTPCTCPCTPP